MKRLIVIITIISCLFPYCAIAEEEQTPNYVSQGLKQVLMEEGIAFLDSSYQESEEKANIYLFRGHGCSACYEFLSYLNAMVPNYGDYFNLISYEVWENSDNNDLMEKVKSYYGNKETGVPYIIIGNHSWNGYSEELTSEIYSAMMEEYDNGNQNDHFEEAMHYEKSYPYADIIIPVCALLLVGAILYIRHKNKEN